MEIKLIAENKTQVKCSNKKENYLIEQLIFVGVKPTKKSTVYTYFEFDGDIAKTSKYLGFR